MRTESTFSSFFFSLSLILPSLLSARARGRGGTGAEILSLLSLSSDQTPRTVSQSSITSLLPFSIFHLSLPSLSLSLVRPARARGHGGTGDLRRGRRHRVGHQDLWRAGSEF